MTEIAAAILAVLGMLAVVLAVLVLTAPVAWMFVEVMAG